MLRNNEEQDDEKKIILDVKTQTNETKVISSSSIHKDYLELSDCQHISYNINRNETSDSLTHILRQTDQSIAKFKENNAKCHPINMGKLKQRLLQIPNICAVDAPLSDSNAHNDGFVVLTEDGGVHKKIITKSNSADLNCPSKHSTVCIRYRGNVTNEPDKQFHSTCDQVHEYKLDDSELIKGWFIGILTMKKGERCLLRCTAPYAYGKDGNAKFGVPGDTTVDFEVHLVSWSDWFEISQGIQKKVVIEGPEDDQCVEDDTTVYITYKIYYIEGDSHHILTDKSNVKMIVNDDDRFTTAFHVAIGSMNVCEQSLFKIEDGACIDVAHVYVDHDEMKQNNHNRRISPNGVDTYYQITMHRADEITYKEDMEWDDWIDMGQQYKNDGNDLFKMGRYAGAIKKYKKALYWIEDEIEDNELNKEKNKLIVSINNNLSILYIKLKQWTQASRYASKVLEIEPNNVKALVRRGQSLLEEGSWDLSRMDLKKASTLMGPGGNKQKHMFVIKLLKTIAIKQQKYDAKQKKLYGGMFEDKVVCNKKKNVSVKGTQTNRDKKSKSKERKKYNRLLAKYNALQKTYKTAHDELIEFKRDMEDIKSDLDALASTQITKDKEISALQATLKEECKRNEKTLALESKHLRKIRFENAKLKRSNKELKKKYGELASTHESTLLKLYCLQKKFKEHHAQFG
eukprot:1027889_1